MEPVSTAPNESHDRGVGGDGDGHGEGDTVDVVARPRSHVAVWVALGLAVLVALLVWLLGTRPEAFNRVERSQLIDRPAPAIVGKTIAGEQFQLADEQGKWVVVNFFATWCVPCRVEHPELVSFSRRHEAAGDATVVSVVYGDEPSEVRAFFEKNGGEWPVVYEDVGRVALDYGVAGVPESFLVDPQGIVRAKITGGVTGLGLDQLLGGLGGGG